MNKALDRIDYEILALLQNNARISNKEIARKVGLAASTCLVRIRLLLSSGVISGFHADISPMSLGVGIQAMIAVRLMSTLRARDLREVGADRGLSAQVRLHAKALLDLRAERNAAASPG